MEGRVQSGRVRRAVVRQHVYSIPSVWHFLACGTSEFHLTPLYIPSLVAFPGRLLSSHYQTMPSNQVTNNDNAVYTTSNGAPVAQPYAAEKLGNHGPLLLQGPYRLP